MPQPPTTSSSTAPTGRGSPGSIRSRAGGPTTSSCASDHGLGQTLRAAIDGLPEGQRQVIVLKLLRGCSFAEIAEATGVGADACKMRFSRGLATVRAELARQGV